MALLLTRTDVERLITDELALEAVAAGFRAERDGATDLPVRLDTDSPTGFLRVMPAVLDNVMGLKVMTLVRGLGTRYLVLLYGVDDGALRALVDADLVTKTRTAATTALAGQHLVAEPPATLAVIGTGFEARGHLAFLARMWGLRRAVAYSRSEANRTSFADDMAAELDIEVVAAETSREALQSTQTVLLATKSPEPVVDGRDFRPGTVVLSIGSTRPDLRELDRTSLRRASVVVVDARDQVTQDSGDIIDALGHDALHEDRIVTLATVCGDGMPPVVSDAERDLVVFKSAGTALQDLALARRLYDRACEQRVGHDLGTVSGLKPFTG